MFDTATYAALIPQRVFLTASKVEDITCLQNHETGNHQSQCHYRGMGVS